MPRDPRYDILFQPVQIGPKTAKLIVGRNEGENEALERLAGGRTRIEPQDVMGPTALLEGEPNPAELQTACQVVARYCDHPDDGSVAFRLIGADGAQRLVSEPPLAARDARLDAWRI